jgi:hypothetical protein
MGRLDLLAAVRALHANALAGLGRALTRGTAMLVARVGDGERPLVDAFGQRTITIDATLFPDRMSVRRQLLRCAVTDLIGLDPVRTLTELGAAGDAARHTLADAYGPSVRHVMALLQYDSTLLLSLPEALAAVDVQVPLVVYDAHRLEQDARWDIRELERPVLLVTRPDHVRELTSQDAPFYGQTQTITLRSPEASEWARALSRAGEPILPTDLEWLLDRSRGRVATTMAAIELKNSHQSYRTAWRQAVQNTVPSAHELLALVRAVHTDAPALLLALAEGRKPYTAIQGAPSQRIARAMNKLRGLDVIESPERNVSRIADPLIEHALQSLVRYGRGR